MNSYGKKSFALLSALLMTAMIFQSVAAEDEYNTGEDMDIFIDSFGNEHQVWRESVNGTYQVFYGYQIVDTVYNTNSASYNNQAIGNVIFNDGFLNIINCTVNGNVIATQGYVVLQDCNIIGNVNIDLGRIQIINCEIIGNLDAKNADLEIRYTQVNGYVYAKQNSFDDYSEIIIGNEITGNLIIKGGTCYVVGNTICGNLDIDFPSNIQLVIDNDVTGHMKQNDNKEGFGGYQITNSTIDVLYPQCTIDPITGFGYVAWLENDFDLYYMGTQDFVTWSEPIFIGSITATGNPELNLVASNGLLTFTWENGGFRILNADMDGDFILDIDDTSPLEYNLTLGDTSFIPDAVAIDINLRISVAIDYLDNATVKPHISQSTILTPFYGIGTCVNISTECTQPFSAYIKFNYRDMPLPMNATENYLRVYWLNNSDWRILKNASAGEDTGIDMENKVAWAKTNHFSSFAIAESSFIDSDGDELTDAQEINADGSPDAEIRNFSDGDASKIADFTINSNVSLCVKNPMSNAAIMRADSASLDILMENSVIAFSEEVVQTGNLDSRVALPSIYEDKVVFADERNGNSDIYMYDLGLGVETQITDDPSYDISPQIWGDYIFWYRTLTDLYLKNLITGEEHKIGDGYAGEIYGNYVVWPGAIYSIDTQETKSMYSLGTPHIFGDYVAYGNYDMNCIMLYDIETEELTPIDLGIIEPFLLDIGESHIIYQDLNTNDLYTYNLNSTEIIRITNNTFGEDDPTIYGHTILWTDSRNGNKDIYGYDLVNKIEFPVCVADGDQEEPAIYGDNIVWTDARNDGIPSLYHATRTAPHLSLKIGTEIAFDVELTGESITCSDFSPALNRYMYEYIDEGSLTIPLTFICNGKGTVSLSGIIIDVYVVNTDPVDNDTDDDGVFDGFEIYTSFTSALNNDTDDDGLSDWDETDRGFRDDFNDGNYTGWDVITGTWNVENGCLSADATASDVNYQMLRGYEQWDNYIFEVNITIISGPNSGILVRYSGGGDLFYLLRAYDATNSAGSALELSSSEQTEHLAYQSIPEIALNSSHRMKVVVIGQEIKCYFDGVLYFDTINSNSPTGKVGLWVRKASHVHYDNIFVNTNVYRTSAADPDTDRDGLSDWDETNRGFKDDFDDGDYTGWDAVTGSWNIENGCLSADATASDINYQMLRGNEQWDNYIFEVNLNIISGPNSGILVRYSGGGDLFYLLRAYDATNPSGSALELSSSEQAEHLAYKSIPEIALNSWHKMKVIVIGHVIRCYFDGVLYFETENSDTPTGKVGLWVRKASHVHYDNIFVNTNIYGTSATHPDTDGDNWLDGVEVIEYYSNPINSDTDYDGYRDDVDIDPLVNLKVTVKITEILQMDDVDSDGDFFVMGYVNSNDFISQTFTGDNTPDWTNANGVGTWDNDPHKTPEEIGSRFTFIKDVPDNVGFVSIQIELFDDDGDNMDDRCDISGRDTTANEGTGPYDPESGRSCQLVYNLKTAQWVGDDEMGDSNGYGHVRGDAAPDGSTGISEASDHEDDCELWFDITQNDADADGLTWWQEVRERAPGEEAYGTDPTDLDTDNDGMTDGKETDCYYTNPLNPDSDGDGIYDGDDWATPSEWAPKDELILCWVEEPTSRWACVLDIINNTVSQIDHLTIIIPYSSWETGVRATLSYLSNPEKLRFIVINNDNNFVRDYGPQFTINQYGQRAIIDWETGNVASELDLLPNIYYNQYNTEILSYFERSSFQFDGGNFQTDGEGIGYTSLGVTSATQEELKRMYGLKELRLVDTLWSDPNHHLDVMAYLASPNTVILPNLIECYNNEDVIRVQNAYNKFKSWGFEVYWVDTLIDTYIFTYNNALVLNDVVLVPQYYKTTYIEQLYFLDQDAINTFQQAFPGKTIIPIDVPVRILEGHGSIHCITLTRPR